MTAAKVAMSTVGFGERAQRGADIGGIDGRQVALHIDHHIDAVFGIERLQSLEDAVGAGQMAATAS